MAPEASQWDDVLATPPEGKEPFFFSLEMQVTEVMHVVRNTKDMDSVDATMAIFMATTRRRCVIHGEHQQKNKQEDSFYTSHNLNVIIGIHDGIRLLHVHL